MKIGRVYLLVLMTVATVLGVASCLSRTPADKGKAEEPKWTIVEAGYSSEIRLVKLPQGTCVAVFMGYYKGGIVVVPEKECQ